MKIKTSELTNAALDWAVGVADGCDLAPVEYSTKWEFGGPIIEREVPTLLKTNGGDWIAQGRYNYADDREAPRYYGPTPLIAAMRCFVALKLGEEIEIPEELK